MFRDILSSRGLIIGLVFFLLVVSGSLLYSWHIRRTSEAELQRGDRFLRGLQKQEKPRAAETVDLPRSTETPGFVSTPEEESDDPHSHDIESEEIDVMSEDDTDLTAPTDVLDNPLEAEVPEPVDFKTTPDGYPMTPYWDYPEDEQNDWSYENKLIDHVLVKLWQQGTRDFIGGSIEHGTNRVRPHYLNTLYVEWEEVEHPDGAMVKIITRALGAGDVNWQQKGPFDLPPPEVHLIDINSTEGKGIDPFTFLTSKEFP